MNDEQIREALTHLNASTAALEDLLVAVVLSLPQRNAIVQSTLKEGEIFDVNAHNAPFQDSDLDAFKEARRRLLALVAKD